MAFGGDVEETYLRDIWRDIQRLEAILDNRFRRECKWPIDPNCEQFLRRCS